MEVCDLVMDTGVLVFKKAPQSSLWEVLAVRECS